MRKAGGIIALIAGILGFFAAIFTLFVGGVGSAFDAQDASVIVWLGWGGVFFSFAVIILGAVQIGTSNRTTSVLLILSSIAGIILGGTFVAICLALSLIGGILGMFEKSNTKTFTSENNQQTQHNNNKIYIAALIALVVLVSFFIMVSLEDSNSSTEIDEHKSLVSNNNIRLENYEPTEQKEFVNIVNESRTAYKAASNDMAKGGVRSDRKDAICRLLTPGHKENWVGVIESLDSNSEGKGILSVSIGNDITLETWNNALSDIASNTLINTKSNLFQIVSTMQEGDHIVFSGSFLRSNIDCVEEQSLTLNGSLSSPSFTFKFLSAMPLEQYVKELAQKNISQEITYEEKEFNEENKSGSKIEGHVAQETVSSDLNEVIDTNVNESSNSQKPPVSVIKQSEKSGFLARDIDALLDISNENSAEIALKSGVDVKVTGKTSDDKYFEILTKIVNQPLFVPIDSVALFED